MSVPITTVSRERDIPSQEWLAHVPRNAGDKFNKEQCGLPSRSYIYMCDTDISLDDINLVEGMPVGVQVVGGRFGEEKCVAVAKAIKQAMRWKDAARPSL
jgi:amidase